MSTLEPQLLEAGQVHLYKDLSYSHGDNGILNQYDVYTPANRPAAPLFIFIHGGAWVCEDKQLFHTFATNLVKQGGFACALINYRLSKKQVEGLDGTAPLQHPTHVQDCLKAVLHIALNPYKISYDTSRLFIGGHSAGGHLSSLIALDPSRYLESYEMELFNRIKFLGVITTQGVFDLVEFKNFDIKYEQNYVVPAFGSNVDEVLKLASPQFTAPTLKMNPSYLLIHSSDDVLVSMSQALNFRDHLKSYSIQVTVNTEPFGPHDEAPQNSSLQTLVIEFINSIINY